jgi:prolyl-tRNA synthetase
MFLRTTGGIRRGKYMLWEFLWQEGHTAHSNHDEALKVATRGYFPAF